MVRRALELQTQGAGFTFVEVLTMCPTGWFVSTPEGTGYLEDVLVAQYGLGELKAPVAP
jgi:2-oxoglutarate ferredoxin oxidoreductase subunit beta